MLPAIKKQVSSFLVSEHGKISRQSLLSLGSFLSAAVIGSVAAAREGSAAHVNNIAFSSGDAGVTAQHLHHQNHSSHSSHGNHSSGTTSTTHGGS